MAASIGIRTNGWIKYTPKEFFEAIFSILPVEFNFCLKRIGRLMQRPTQRKVSQAETMNEFRVNPAAHIAKPPTRNKMMGGANKIATIETAPHRIPVDTESFSNHLC